MLTAGPFRFINHTFLVRCPSRAVAQTLSTLLSATPGDPADDAVVYTIDEDGEGLLSISGARSPSCPPGRIPTWQTA